MYEKFNGAYFTHRKSVENLIPGLNYEFETEVGKKIVTPR